MTKHRSIASLASLDAASPLSGPHRSAAEPPAMTVEWQATGQDLRSAEARLDIGGPVYLSVERLGAEGWDWLVWDASCQALPRYGQAETEAGAKRQAELKLAEMNDLLRRVVGELQDDAASPPLA